MVNPRPFDYKMWSWKEIKLNSKGILFYEQSNIILENPVKLEETSISNHKWLMIHTYLPAYIHIYMHTIVQFYSRRWNGADRSGDKNKKVNG